MSDYQIAKDILGLQQRIDRLEQAAFPPGAEGFDSDAGSPKLEDADVCTVPTVEAIPAETGDESALVLPPASDLLVRIAGGCRRWNSGFPDWRNYSSYSGNIWLQNKNSGDKLVFDFIETGSQTFCEIQFEDRSRVTSSVQNTHICPFGFRGHVGGKVGFSSWARFRMSNGAGYNVRRWTCFC